jgi:hypothetical protein
MNERIHKLAEQANLYARSDNSSMIFENFQKRYTEKLVELVVQDCVAEIALMGVTNFENEDISWACGVIIDGIKKKFGDE